MAIGERLKMARRMAGLSMRELAEVVGVSAMAISKYERNKIVPSSGALVRLAQALDVKTEFFLRPVSVALSPVAYRSQKSLLVRDKNRILGQTQEWLERYIDIESLFGDPLDFSMPNIDRRVRSLDDVERFSLDLRRAWNLGFDPIENLTEVLEIRGIKVGIVNGVEGFDALTLWADDKAPVIVVKKAVPGDRQRFNLAHELGHLMLEPVEEIDEEKAAYRFAGAFLVPKPVAYLELGRKRQALHLYELHLLKHKYGLSMQAWIYRARDLDIISESAAAREFRRFREQDWRRVEPGDPIPPEKPDRMKRLVLRALAEDTISRSRAAEILGMPLIQFWQNEAKQHGEFPLPVCS